jgi:rSAM/selenodomain-associated transferase 1
MTQTLCIFARAPEKGQVKTRLAKTLGDDVAMQVYRALLAHTGVVASQWPGLVRVYVAGDANRLHDSPLGAFTMASQTDGSLGARLMDGMSKALKESPSGAIAIGTDCPLLHVDHLTALATGLVNKPVAIGPARDGGYWGIAVNSLEAATVCFAEDLPWSTPTLMVATRKRLMAASIPCGHGELLDDLDTLADLNRAEAAGFRWSNQGSS